MLIGRLLEKRATEEGVALRVAVSECGCDLDCEAGRLRQIVFNMTTDAISRCRDGGRVELGARCAKDSGAEIYTLETWPGGKVADPARAEAASLTLPFIRRLVAQEGGRFEMQAGADASTLSTICHLRQAAPAGEPASG